MTNFEQAFRYYARKAPRQWFTVKNEVGDDTAKVYLYDQIGGMSGVSASEFVQALNEIGADVIEVHINCPGGSVYDGIAIMNALRQHPARIVSFVDGLAASAASYIAVGGADEVVMCENSELMIHDAWGACIGDSAEMQRMADDLERISNNIASVYARRSGGELEQWRAAMLEETWYTADEAVAAGLADRVAPDDEDESEEPTDALSARASKDRWNLTYYQHAGRDDAPRPFIPAGTTAGHELPAASAVRATDQVAPAARSSQKGSAVAFTNEQLTTMRQELGLPGDADEQTILNALSEALAERADDAAPTNPVPDGMVLMDQATAEELRASAELGRQAHETQQTQARQATVAAAVRDGRIPPSRREHWENALAADPEGMGTVLAGLEPGMIPLTELGHDQDGPLASDQADKDYQALWGAHETQKQEA